jgi:hypothetical protein
VPLLLLRSGTSSAWWRPVVPGIAWGNDQRNDRRPLPSTRLGAPGSGSVGAPADWTLTNLPSSKPRRAPSQWPNGAPTTRSRRRGSRLAGALARLRRDGRPSTSSLKADPRSSAGASAATAACSVVLTYPMATRPRRIRAPEPARLNRRRPDRRRHRTAGWNGQRYQVRHPAFSGGVRCGRRGS